MDTTQFLFFVWIMFLAIFILSLLFALFTPKAFTYTSQNPKSKQLIRKILITKPIREYRRQLKISILFSTLGLIVMWIGIILFTFKFVIVSLFLLAIASASYIFIGVVTPYYEYKYWSRAEKKEFGTLPHKSFIKLMTCRTICTITLTLLFLLPAIFNSEFYDILFNIFS
ncbi:hypothetical protein AB5567_02395 [Lactiplantibacillus plantarum]|uniref:hypothetical protein n=1 Tax=Lactiplantibacillus plantarum TaxID=1590 RepID=UPI00351CAA12